MENGSTPITAPQANQLSADEFKDPVKIKAEHYDRLRDIQRLVDELAKFRQEMGRLTQVIGNMREEANKLEIELAQRRRELASEYSLEKSGTSQWALDFDQKEFVKLSSDSPIVP